MTYQYAKVTEQDIPVVTTVVNSAYEGEPGKSWTAESNFVEGQRTTEDGLRKLIQQPAVTMLKCVDAQGTIVGCVLLEEKANTLYLGMLSVSPAVQASGIGKLLLQQGELFAQERGLDSVTITVIDQRHELIDWYRRKGFAPTGKQEPFNNLSSKALGEFYFMEMRKELATVK
jgi:ribosomal protein S18 acetylase RimI-like enzyme